MALLARKMVFRFIPKESVLSEFNGAAKVRNPNWSSKKLLPRELREAKLPSELKGVSDVPLRS